MLFSKPLIMFYQHYTKSKVGTRFVNSADTGNINLSINGEDSDHKASNGHASSANIIELEEEEPEEKV
jgi:hypothetical protein